MAVFDFFDDIVCITLQDRPDRKKHAQEVFEKLHIPVRFYSAKRHPNGGVYGCFASHIDVVRECYAKGGARSC